MQIELERRRRREAPELTLIRKSFAVFTCLLKNYPRLAEAYGPSLPVKTHGSSRVVSGWGAPLLLLGFGFTFGVLGLPSSLHSKIANEYRLDLGI